MSKYRFLKNNKISAQDIKRLMVLMKKDALRWSHSDRYAALNAHPTLQQANNNPKVSAEIIGENLRGIRLGYNPVTGLWHYLRLVDHNGNWYYIEKSAPEKLKSLVNQLYTHAILQVSHQLGLPESFSLVVNANRKVFERSPK